MQLVGTFFLSSRNKKFFLGTVFVFVIKAWTRFFVSRHERGVVSFLLSG